MHNPTPTPAGIRHSRNIGTDVDNGDERPSGGGDDQANEKRAQYPDRARDHADETGLNDHSEKTEPREHVPGVDDVKIETPRGEHGECRRADGKRTPVDEIGNQKRTQPGGRRSTAGTARHGDTETALPRCTVSGSQIHAIAAATTVTAAAAQIGAV